MGIKGPIAKSVCPTPWIALIVGSSVFLRFKQVLPFAVYPTKYPHPVALFYPKTTAGKFEVNLVKTELKVN